MTQKELIDHCKLHLENNGKCTECPHGSACIGYMGKFGTGHPIKDYRSERYTDEEIKLYVYRVRNTLFDDIIVSYKPLEIGSVHMGTEISPWTEGCYEVIKLIGEEVIK